MPGSLKPSSDCPTLLRPSVDCSVSQTLRWDVFSGRSAISLIDLLPTRPRHFLLTATAFALAGLGAAVLKSEIGPKTVRTSVAASSAAAPPALTPDEERYAAVLWEIHREVTSSAVAMSFAGIALKTEISDTREFERRLEKLVPVFREAEERARQVTVPPKMQDIHIRYAGALGRYAQAAEEMLKFAQDGEPQHLSEAHDISIRTSEDMLRVGDILWPGHYKPH